MNQVETNPFCQQVAEQALMREEGVQIESWAPFAEGRNDLFHNAVLRSIADEHGRSIAQVVLRWLIQRGIVAIPKSVHKERIVENFAVWDFALSQADMHLIATLDMGCSRFFSHSDPLMVRQLGARRLDL